MKFIELIARQIQTVQNKYKSNMRFTIIGYIKFESRLNFTLGL